MDSPTYNGAAGGDARAQKLSQSKRSEIAKKAAAARWEETREAVCGSPDHPLTIGDFQIECYVLEDGTRVISQSSFLLALGRARTVRRTETGGLPPIVQGKALQPFLPDGLAERAQPIPFTVGGRRHLGYEATLLPEVCEAFLAARQAGELPQNQLHIAERAEILVRGLARVGIIALIDEATGYQDIRTKNALERLLAEFIDKDLQVYLPTFPPDFYRELFRLRGLEYNEKSFARPQYFGLLTNDIVYKRLAPGVLDELKKVQEKSATGKPKHKLFQRLTTNVGYPKLREHLGSVVTLMKLSDDYEDFKVKLEAMHPKPEIDGQEVLDMPIDIRPPRKS